MPACESCGVPLKPEEEAAGKCFACRMEGIQNKISPRLPSGQEPAPKAGLPLGTILQVLSVAVFMVILLRMMPVLMDTLEPEKPLRTGSMDADPGTDACVTELWRAAAAMQEGRNPADHMCPVSGLSYELREGRIYCPNPSRHGLGELSSSEVDPLPLLVN